MKSILFLQQVNFGDKLKNAPDSGYQTGLIIGSFVPFIILIVLAYWMYHNAKKRDAN
jgi:hypothetical protein